MVKMKRVRTANDSEYEGDDATDTHLSPPKPKRGRPTAKAGKEPVRSAAGMAAPKAITVRGKVLPPRSPQPARTNRNNHPGMVAMPRAKRTSAEVDAFEKRKADLRHQADELERQQIETLAEMELQEELDEAAEAQSVIKKLPDAGTIDDVEDVEMQSNDGEGTGASVAETGSEVASDEDESDSDEPVVVKKSAPKAKKVRCLGPRCCKRDY